MTPPELACREVGPNGPDGSTITSFDCLVEPRTRELSGKGEQREPRAVAAQSSTPCRAKKPATSVLHVVALRWITDMVFPMVSNVQEASFRPENSPSLGAPVGSAPPTRSAKASADDSEAVGYEKERLGRRATLAIFWRPPCVREFRT